MSIQQSFEKNKKKCYQTLRLASTFIRETIWNNYYSKQLQLHRITQLVKFVCSVQSCVFYANLHNLTIIRKGCTFSKILHFLKILQFWKGCKSAEFSKNCRIFKILHFWGKNCRIFAKKCRILGKVLPFLIIVNF